MSRPLAAVAMFAAAACSEVPPLESLVFACREDSECALGTVCDPRRRVCVAPSARSDAGAPDADLEAPDAGGPAPFPSGCSPDVPTATASEHAWCRGLTGPELVLIVDRMHARLLDVEVERESAGGTFSAALVRDANGARDAWSPSFGRDEFGAVLPPGLLFTELNRLGAQDDYAGIMSAIPGAWFRATDATAASLESDVLAALASFSWRPPYYPRVISIERAPLLGGDVYSWVTRVRGEARATTVRFAVTADEVAAFAATHTILDVEDAATRGRYDVVTARRDPADPPAHFVHAATIEALDRALVERRAHVVRLVPERIDGEPRWSALIVRTATSPAVSIAERLSDGSPGDAVIFLGNTAGSTVTAHRADRPVRAGRLVYLLALFDAVARIQAGELTLETSVSVPSSTAGCPSGRPSTTVRLGDALARMIVDDADDVARGVILRLSTARLAARARALGVSPTALSGVAGCRDERFVASLAELARILRAADRLLDAPHRAVFDSYLLGERPEPQPADDERWGLAPVLEEMVREEAARVALPAERRLAFQDATRLRYLRVVHAGEAAGTYDETYMGTVDLPTCEGATRWVWGVGLVGAPFDADADRAVALLRLEPTRPALAAALTAYARCPR